MSVASILARARSRHQLLMIDTCVIERETVGSFNASTGDYDGGSWATVYSGQCQVVGPYPRAVTVTEKDAGWAQQSTQRQQLVLPHGTTNGIEVGDRVTVTGSNSDDVFRVVGQSDATTMTARAVLIEKVEDPESP